MVNLNRNICGKLIGWAIYELLHRKNLIFRSIFHIFSKTGIWPKWAFRGPFRGSERPKISIFPKFFEITIKTLVRLFSSKIYVFGVQNTPKHHYIAEIRADSTITNLDFHLIFVPQTPFHGALEG